KCCVATKSIFLLYLPVGFFKLGCTEMVGVRIAEYLLQQTVRFVRDSCAVDTAGNRLYQFLTSSVKHHKLTHLFHTLLLVYIHIAKKMSHLMKPRGRINRKHIFIIELIVRSYFLSSFYNLPGMIEIVVSQIWMRILFEYAGYML